VKGVAGLAGICLLVLWAKWLMLFALLAVVSMMMYRMHVMSNDRKELRKLDLAIYRARADLQNGAYLRGDTYGIYGEYDPATMPLG